MTSRYGGVLHFLFLSISRFRLEHREGGELRVRHHPADLWEAHLGQQRRQPVLVSPHRPGSAGAGLGAVATIELVCETVEFSVAISLSLSQTHSLTHTHALTHSLFYLKLR